MNLTDADKLIDEVPDKAVDANLKDRHFRRFVKALIYFLSEQVDEPVGAKGALNYYLNMRSSEGHPLEVDMVIIAENIARDGSQS